MTTTEKREIFDGDDFIPKIATSVQSELISQGYDVTRNELANGDIFLSITKSGFFRAISGFKTAINLSLRPISGNRFEAASKFGLWDTQSLPTALSLLVFWPILVTQILGYNAQRKLNDKIIALVRKSLEEAKNNAEAGSGFRPDYGTQCGESAAFVPKGGKTTKGEL